MGGHLCLGVLHVDGVLALRAPEQVALHIEGKAHRGGYVPLLKEHPHRELIVHIGKARQAQGDGDAVPVVQRAQVVQHPLHAQGRRVWPSGGEEQLIALPDPVELLPHAALLAGHGEGALPQLLPVGDAQVHVLAALDVLKPLDNAQPFDAGFPHHDLPAQVVQCHPRLQGKGLAVRQKHAQAGHDARPVEHPVAQPPFVVQIGLLALKVPNRHQLPAEIVVAFPGTVLQVVHSNSPPVGDWVRRGAPERAPPLSSTSVSLPPILELTPR